MLLMIGPSRAELFTKRVYLHIHGHVYVCMKMNECVQICICMYMCACLDVHVCILSAHERG